MSEQDDPQREWLEWWAEAQAIVAHWEGQMGRFLTTRQSTELTQAIAQGLRDAFERGRAAPPEPD
jgi:hypothetical protein